MTTKMGLLLFALSFFAVISAHAGEVPPPARVDNCIANGQFSTSRSEAIQKCADRTSMSPSDCEKQAQCFGPISFCMTGIHTGSSLESVIASCSRTKPAADCEKSLRCFSNVSSCEANGQVGTSAEEALDYCVFRTKMSRLQCQENLHCQEEKYPMPPRPQAPPKKSEKSIR
jgi:hypothetical protein